MSLTRKIVVLLSVFAALSLAPSVFAQTCAMANDVDAATRAALDNATQQYFSMLSRADGAGVQAAATPVFSNAGQVVNDHAKEVAGASAKMRWVFLLDYSNPKPGEPADFYCGVFNSPDRIAFQFNELPAGRYAIVVQDATGGKTPYMLTWILQQSGNQWRIAGLIPKATQIAGRDGVWYWRQAREYAKKGQRYNAYFYYQIADGLLRPIPVMSTPNLDKLADEWQKATPPGMPPETPLTLASVDKTAAGRTYQVTQMFVTAVENQPHLVVRYSVPDVSNTQQAFNDNTAVMRALLQRFPELREAFQGVVARATAPTGQDYGTLLAMKDIK